MDELLQKLNELYDEHFRQANGLQGVCDGIAQWHYGYAQAAADIIEELAKIKDAL